MEKIRVKGLLGHQLKDFTYAAILDTLCDIAIQKYDPREKSPRPPKVIKPAAVTPAQELKSRITPAQQTTRYIPAVLKRAVWIRDQGQCTNCGTTSYLECDHCIPFGLGSATELDNLRLRCRACNAAAAIKAFGLSHMEHVSRRNS